MSEHTPKIIANRYQITERIGQGGMGDVFRGTDNQTGQEVAIKRLKPDILESDPNLLERFEREGEALRKLNHPNIVKMLDTVAEDEEHYLVLQYVGGGSLRERLDVSPRLPVERVLAIGIELADALTRAHHLKIIHRDLKPANVLLDDDGTPLLTDFGVARIGTRTRVTETGSVIGTYAYLSPEACMGEDLDTRADIWSFGVMLYEMVAGQRPFDSEQSTAILLAIMNNPMPDLAALRPDVPPTLIQLIGGMLQKDREQRVPSVRVVGAALEAIQAGAADTSLPPGLPISGQGGDPGSRFATPTPAPVTSTGAPSGEEPLVIFGPPTGEQPAQPTGPTPTPTGQIPGQHPGYTPTPAQPDTTLRWKSLTIMFTVTVVAAVAVLAIVLFSGALGGDSNGGGARIVPGNTPPPTLPPGQPPPSQPGMPQGPDQTGSPPGPVSEYIVLVADLEPVGEVAERDAARFIYNNLVARLEREIPFSNIRVERYNATITDAPAAQQIAIENRAAVIVWGTYDATNVQIDVQVGITGAFPYVDQAVRTGMLDRRLLEATANVTVRLTDEREQSVAIPVLNVLNVLQTADGNAYETIRLITIMDAIAAETGDIVSGGVGASLHEGQLLYLDETARAVEAYSAAIDLAPSNPLLYMYRATGYLRLGNTARALRDIDTAERLGPANWTTPLYLRATYSSDPDTLDESIATLDTIIAQRPDDWFAYNYRAGLYYLQGSYDQAKPDLNRAIDLGPNANFPYIALFTIALRAGQFEDLQDYLETTLTNFANPTFSMRIAEAFFGTESVTMPVFGPMYAAFGELLLGQYERALENVDQALAINPNIADLYLVQGLAHCALGDYEAAEAAYTRGIEVEPDYIALYALRAETHLRQNDLTALNADASVVIQSDLAPMFAALMQAGLTGEWQCDQFFDFDYSALTPVDPGDLTELDTLPASSDEDSDHE